MVGNPRFAVDLLMMSLIVLKIYVFPVSGQPFPVVGDYCN